MSEPFIGLVENVTQAHFLAWMPIFHYAVHFLKRVTYSCSTPDHNRSVVCVCWVEDVIIINFGTAPGIWHIRQLH